MKFPTEWKDKKCSKPPTRLVVALQEEAQGFPHAEVHVGDHVAHAFPELAFLEHGDGIYPLVIIQIIGKSWENTWENTLYVVNIL